MKSLPRATGARRGSTTRMSTPFVYCLLAAALYVTAPAVWAADAADADTTDGKATGLNSVTVESTRDHEFLVDISTVGAKFPTPTLDIPQQVTVISQDLMTTQADISLQ